MVIVLAVGKSVNGKPIITKAQGVTGYETSDREIQRNAEQGQSASDRGRDTQKH